MIRHKFYGGGRDLPATGHLYLRQTETGWLLTEWQAGIGQERRVEGTDKAEAGRMFADLLYEFFTAWCTRQTAASLDFANWLSRYSPDDILPGKRRTLKKHWTDHVNAVRAEEAGIHRDIRNSHALLLAGGWQPPALPELERIECGYPWKKK